MSYKNCQAWADAQMPMSTPSDEAAKMFDVIMKQFMTRYPEPSLNMDLALTEAMKADPHFVMGHVWKTICAIPDTGVPLVDKKCQEIIEEFRKNIEPVKASMTEWEKKHVAAVEQLAVGGYEEACDIWEQILKESPTDMLALKLVYGFNIYIGDSKKLQALPEEAMKHYNKTDLYYGFLLGMYAFGLEENGSYKEAETCARDALALNKTDSWSTHSMAHIFEETARYDEGIEFMTSTVADWKPEQSLMCHNLWHNTLFYLEKMDTEGVLTLLDQELLPIIKSNACNNFNISDAATLLHRLEIAGVKVGKDRWQAVNEACLNQPLCTFAYYDVSHMMACSGAKDHERQKKLMKDLQEFSDNFPDATVAKRWKKSTKSAFDALIYDSTENWSEVVDCLKDEYSSGYATIGGSHAQRDVLTMTLIDAASMCSDTRDFAKKLLDDRKSTKNTPLTERLFLNFHAAEKQVSG